MTKQSTLHTLALATLVWLLIELFRGWTPLLITVFGRAAETPPEVLGAFALGVTATPLVVLLVLGRRLVAVDTVVPVLLVVALIARLALPFLGGRPLLVVATVGVVAAVLALSLAAGRAGRILVPGLFTGVALAAVTHAALGTWAAVWRDDLAGLVVDTVLIVLVVLSLRPLWRAAPDPAPRQAGWLLFPTLLLAGITLANPARALVVSSWGAVLVAVAVTVAAALSARARGPFARAGAAVILVVAVAVTMLPDPLATWSLLGFALGMPALAVLLPAGSAPAPSAGSVTSVAAGAALFTVVLFGFYAGYDLGYRADLLIVGLAVVVALVGLLPVRRASGPAGGPRLWQAAVAGIVAAALAGVGPLVTIRTLPDSPPADGANVRLAAWNLRMGFGIDGTSRPDTVAGVLREEGADVVLLSEIDRGWLLNGGQDQLRILARMLDYHLAFGPAGDQVWGDAILSRWPLSDVQSTRLPAYDSLTGAQALSATVATPTGALQVISTHVQPDAVGSDPTLRQTQDVARLVQQAKGDGVPVALGGDFNFEPGSGSWKAITGVGMDDALEKARPLTTWSSDAPTQQIDHIFVSDGVSTSNPRTRQGLWSDHLPVFVDLDLR